MKDAQSDSQRKKAIRKNTSSTLDFIPACTPPVFDATAGLSEQMVNVMAMYQVKMSAEEESVLQLGHGTGSQREEQQRKSCEYLCVCVCVRVMPCTIHLASCSKIASKGHDVSWKDSESVSTYFHLIPHTL